MYWPRAGLYQLQRGYFLLYLVAFALYVSRGFYGSAGPQGSICVDSGHPYDGTLQGFAASPGAALRAGGDITACALHAGVGQWALSLR